jgi:hypothetical protein
MDVAFVVQCDQQHQLTGLQAGPQEPVCIVVVHVFFCILKPASRPSWRGNDIKVDMEQAKKVIGYRSRESLPWLRVVTALTITTDGRAPPLHKSFIVS